MVQYHLNFHQLYHNFDLIHPNHEHMSLLGKNSDIIDYFNVPKKDRMNISYYDDLIIADL